MDTTISAKYEPNTTKPVYTKWVRITGQFTPEMLPSCTELSGVHVCLESGESAAPYTSMDLDDFILTDINLWSTSSLESSPVGL